MLKKVIIFTVLATILFSSFSLSAFADIDDEINVEAYYLYDLNHNIPMKGKNTQDRISPSSTAKIMTACIILESGLNMNQTVNITSNMLRGVSGRSMYLKEGNILTVEDLLYAMICGGYNDATHILALAVSNSISEFTDKMNQKAQELGMSNTHYVNPTGVSAEGMLTTVEDIVKLIEYVIKNEIFLNISSTKSYKLSDTAKCDYKVITNRSSLLGEYKNLYSLNIGSSDNGDYAVTIYKTPDLSLISIVMNAQSHSSSNTNCAELFTKSLIKHALTAYSTKTVKTKKEIIISLPVKYSISSEKINVYLQNDVQVFLENDIDIEKDLDYSICINNGELVAPLKSGDTVGMLNVFYNGVLVGNMPLIVNENIERNAFLYLMDMLKQFILNYLLLIVSLLLLILIFIYYRKQRRKRKFKRKKKHKRKKPT